MDDYDIALLNACMRSRWERFITFHEQDPNIFVRANEQSNRGLRSMPAGRIGI